MSEAGPRNPCYREAGQKFDFRTSDVVGLRDWFLLSHLCLQREEKSDICVEWRRFSSKVTAECATVCQIGVCTGVFLPRVVPARLNVKFTLTLAARLEYKYKAVPIRYVISNSRGITYSVLALLTRVEIAAYPT